MTKIHNGQTFLFGEAVPELKRGALVFDYFAGAGGASTGIEQALGRSPDVAINHCPNAVACHKLNHPNTDHYQVDVWDVDPKRHLPPGDVEMAWFSPNCFPAGTMILTRAGHRPIEGVRVGDEVLTHERRWRRVTATMTAVRQVVKLRGHGHPGLVVSEEHPFLTRRRLNVWNNAERRYTRQLVAADWTPAADIRPGLHYWGSPTEFPGDEPPAVSVYKGRTVDVDTDLMWLAGRYIADGWTRIDDERGELIITCGHKKTEDVRAHLAAWSRRGARAGAGEMMWHERDTATAHQFSTSSRGLVEWLRENFGHGAAEKRIPGWALGMAEDLRRSLLAGYLAGDGYRGTGRGQPLVEATTVSKALAFGIKALAASLGFSPTVYLNENPTTVIQGRNVNAKPVWAMRWRDPVAVGRAQTERGNGIEWAPVREVERLGAESTVFNLSVEEDESYVADGLIVHNCTHFSRAKGGKPVSKKIRGLAWVVVRVARERKPRVIFLENVAEFATWGPLDADGMPVKAKAGQTFRAFVRKLEKLGYAVEHRVLNAADYGAPTLRKRLVMVARRDDRPIVWPTPTHGPGRAHPYRTAAECIDWSIPCPSIFDRPRPLADATCKRLADGIMRYVVNAQRPFIVPVKTHGGGGNGPSDIDAPLRTITASKRGEFALVTAWLAKHYGGVVGHSVERPLGTITTVDHHSVVACHLTKFYGTSVGADVDAPAPTITGQGQHIGLVAAFLTKYYSSSNNGQALTEPMHTVVTKDRFGLVTVLIDGETYAIADIGLRMLTPRELARAQGFEDSFQLVGTQTEQVARIGNSVSPPMARAVVAANI